MWGYGNMMGYDSRIWMGSFWGWGFWLVVFIDLVLLGFWLWQQIQKLQK